MGNGDARSCAGRLVSATSNACDDVCGIGVIALFFCGKRRRREGYEDGSEEEEMGMQGKGGLAQAKECEWRRRWRLVRDPHQGEEEEEEEEEG
jgi:hypothetical protein